MDISFIIKPGKKEKDGFTYTQVAHALRNISIMSVDYDDRRPTDKITAAVLEQVEDHDLRSRIFRAEKNFQAVNFPPGQDVTAVAMGTHQLYVYVATEEQYRKATKCELNVMLSESSLFRKDGSNPLPTAKPILVKNGPTVRTVQILIATMAWDATNEAVKPQVVNILNGQPIPVLGEAGHGNGIKFEFGGAYFHTQSAGGLFAPGTAPNSVSLAFTKWHDNRLGH